VRLWRHCQEGMQRTIKYCRLLMWRWYIFRVRPMSQCQSCDIFEPCFSVQSLSTPMCGVERLQMVLLSSDILLQTFNAIDW
jgi:hypothetical protein